MLGACRRGVGHLLSRVAHARSVWTEARYRLRAQAYRCALSTSAKRSGSALVDVGESRPFNNVVARMADMEKSALSPAQFPKHVEEATRLWKEQGVAAAWIQVPVEMSWAAAICHELGYELHHSEDNMIHMMQWLDDTRSCGVPPFNTHQMGVGGLVITDDLHVLAIKEKVMISKGYKLPGGRVDPGEDMSAAVVREVFEETGIRARFHSLIAVRHISRFMRQNTADVYAICRLIPESMEITKCERELSEARWMHIDDFIDNTFPANKKLFTMLREQLRAADGKHNECTLPADMLECIFDSPYKGGVPMHYYLNDK